MSVAYLQNSISVLAQCLNSFKLSCYISPFNQSCFSFCSVNTNSQFPQPPNSEPSRENKKGNIKHNEDAKTGIGKRKRVSIMQYNQEHLCWNSLTPLSRQLHICNILMRQGKKKNRSLTVQIGKHNKTFKIPFFFFTQTFDYPVPLSEWLISCICAYKSV